MWYKVTELKSKGLRCVQIAHHLGLHRHTVEKYCNKQDSEMDLLDYHRPYRPDNYGKGLLPEEVSGPFVYLPNGGTKLRQITKRNCAK